MMSDAQCNHIINTCMDVAANTTKFRQVLIITVTHEGMINVVQQRDDAATQAETLGVYRLLAADTEQQLIARWQDNDRPHHEDSNE